MPFNRTLKLLDYFDYESDIERLPFLNKSNWTPKIETISSPISKLVQNNYRTVTLLNSPLLDRDNLDRHQRLALTQLKNNKDIVIKPADKGSAVVILDRQQYLLEARRQLDNPDHYIRLPHSIQNQTQSLLIVFQKLQTKGYINHKQKMYLIGPNPPRPRCFYLLPKVHKDPKAWTIPFEVPQGRPIVSDCGSESYNSAQYVDHFLNPLSQIHDSYLKDAYDFIEKIRDKSFPGHAFLFTADIESLYTNIDTRLGLEAVRECFNRHPDPCRPDDLILQLLEINLTRNDFEFDKQCYLQIQGTAMGKMFAPSYANIYMAYWERTLQSKFTERPALYFRYLDDLFGVWSHGPESFDRYVALANSHHGTIRLKAHVHNDSVDFLDTTVFFSPMSENKKTLLTKVYFKPTDTHCLLHKHSFHPRHTFAGLVKSQLIRFYRICSRREDFEGATLTLFRALRKRGYSKRFLRKIKNHTVHFLHSQEPTLGTDTRDVIPFITTYNIRSRMVNFSIKNQFQKVQSKHLPLQRFHVVSAYRKNQNLKDLLVRSSLPSDPVAAPPTWTKYFRQPKVLWTDPRGHVALPRITLLTRNVVYLITCTHCDHRYVGETGKTLQTQLKQHLRNINLQNLNTPLVKHFASIDLSYFIISGLEANFLWSSGERKRREMVWIRDLNTSFPCGFNIGDRVWAEVGDPVW
ncbi:uncharacterized protein LOC113646099 isoform X1 [Tachysurus fulvidraco]|uniref:uncharacterized protein LOC113646099 isoform X1 n=1 Tax=Tachysurus fulvidraco TaxID=1234273 RepID=UPI001FEE48AA|nr:uncharacterized protein LOC113646099 isoform X1 [Tachysurus fulvidraco]XP_047665626.1 uncharacterized protein LOC113646099 isoform X1 [Tachysurus fulvidraco]XP_047665627.1 uncharacterized protein LOC113646099 isoform X1 [Tachysurus fulvidraco]XP_047665628.1 uncharacterized protein LOC113646099 isoform X1 [Tachysurus fulvidraco]XP_047665629.1 uncharacterized protein LOC113646099 isoform X1 [Tachysurus fulvidraco]XP_047665630.1 uncharacterized protein LOC113646099 isoform X1 [Tachysurus fulvi